MTRSDDVLLHRAHALDDQALACIFDTYYRPLYRYVVYHVRHAQTAEDLVAEVFVRLLEALSTGKGPTRYLKAWLFRVAHNIIVDDSRRQTHRTHEELVDVAAGENVEETLHTMLMAEQALELLDTLTPKQRAIIILKFVEGMPNGQVAQVLGISVGAVKSLQHRALNTLQRHMAVPVQQRIEVHECQL